jgi:hypothetical protein
MTATQIIHYYTTLPFLYPAHPQQDHPYPTHPLKKTPTPPMRRSAVNKVSLQSRRKNYIPLQQYAYLRRTRSSARAFVFVFVLIDRALINREIAKRHGYVCRTDTRLPSLFLQTEVFLVIRQPPLLYAS